MSSRFVSFFLRGAVIAVAGIANLHARSIESAGQVIMDQLSAASRALLADIQRENEEQLALLRSLTEEVDSITKETARQQQELDASEKEKKVALFHFLEKHAFEEECERQLAQVRSDNKLSWETIEELQAQIAQLKSKHETHVQEERFLKGEREKHAQRLVCARAQLRVSVEAMRVDIIEMAAMLRSHDEAQAEARAAMQHELYRQSIARAGGSTLMAGTPGTNQGVRPRPLREAIVECVTSRGRADTGTILADVSQQRCEPKADLGHVIHTLDELVDEYVVYMDTYQCFHLL